MKIFKLKLPYLMTALLTATAFSLTACGGAETSGSSSSNNSTTAGTAGETQSLAKLEIDQANELRSVSELGVEVSMETDRSFLSICLDPGEAADVNSLDYENCMIRSPLQANTNNFTVELPNHVDRLVAVIWFYETDKAPIIERWRQGDTGALWRINEAG